MSGKGRRYIITLPSLHDDDYYQFKNMAFFIESKKYGKEQKQVLYGESLLVNCSPRKRILVVDDEFDTSLTIKVVLETDNFTASVVYSPWRKMNTTIVIVAYAALLSAVSATVLISLGASAHPQTQGGCPTIVNPQGLNCQNPNQVQGGPVSSVDSLALFFLPGPSVCSVIR